MMLPRSCQAIFGLLITLFSLTVSAEDYTNLCGTYDNWNSTNPAYPYLFINNAWGNDSSGFSCLNVMNSGAAWNVTYEWTGTPTLVKGYPHMKYPPGQLPVPLGNISQLLLKGQWQTCIESTCDSSLAIQTAALQTAQLHSDVAIDIFLSDNATNSTESNPPIEIMIWPWYIPTVKPLGWDESTPTVDTVVVGGTPYSLYHGWNQGGQHVFSWLANTNVTSVDVDYSPLLKYIWQKGLLSPNLWVGQLEFGTEVLHSGNVTVFRAWDYNLTLVRTQDEPVAQATTTVTLLPTPTSPANATVNSVLATSTSTTKASATSKSSADGSLRLGGMKSWDGSGSFAVLVSLPVLVLWGGLLNL